MLFDVTTILTLLDGLLQVSALCTPKTDHRIVIASQIDADVLSLCDTIDGSIYINATGSISLDGVRNITGSLSAGEGISAIMSDSLFSIGGMLQLEELVGLETVRFPSLLSVGSLSLSLPDLRTLYFGAGLQNLSGIMVEGHPKRNFVVNGTGLQELQGLNFPTADKLLIENNANFRTITLGLENLGNSTIISSNGNETSLSCPILSAITGNTSFQNL